MRWFRGNSLFGQLVEVDQPSAPCAIERDDGTDACLFMRVNTLESRSTCSPVAARTLVATLIPWRSYRVKALNALLPALRVCKFESLRDRQRPPSVVCTCTNNPTSSNTYTCNHAGPSRSVVIEFAIQENPTR